MLVSWNEGPCFFPRGDNYEIVKIQWQNLKKHLANFNPTWHPLVKGIQVYSNEGPHPFTRGDNNVIAKYIDEIWKSSAAESLGLFQPNLA